jgi:hypothetical protein
VGGLAWFNGGKSHKPACEKTEADE